MYVNNNNETFSAKFGFSAAQKTVKPVRPSVKMDEKAVSPVIGVILMVAVTVIMAAIVGAFTFGIGGDLETKHSVAVTARQTTSTTVDLTCQGGPDATLVEHMNCTINGAAFTRMTFAETTAYNAPGVPVFGGNATPAVGDTVRCIDLSGRITPGQDHVIVTATFMDGTRQIVMDTYV